MNIHNKLLKLAFIFFIFLLAVFMAVNYLLYRAQKKSKAGGEAVTVSLSPSLFSFTANQDLSTIIKIQPSVDMTIRGYYFTLNFDKTKLQLKNIEYKLGTVSQGLGDDNSKLSSINQSGIIKIVGEVQSATGYVLLSSKQTEVAGLTFNSISDGNTSIAIDPNSSKIIKINADSSLSEIPVVTSSTTPSPTGGVTQTPIPSITSANCKLTNVNGTNVIYVTPQGGSGTCHNLQEAIDAVNIEGVYIKLSQGSYIIPESGNDFSIKIINKNKLTIVGVSTLGTNAVKLLFRGNRGGILIENSTGSLEWMNISGQTTNGLIYLKNSPKFALTYDKFSDEGANTVQINNSSNISIMNCIIKSGSVAIYPSSSNNIIIKNNTIYSSNIGFESGSSSGEIKYNLIYNNKEGGIALNFGNKFNIVHNTIVKNGIYGILHEWRPERENILSIANNIVVGHQFGLESSWSSTPSASFVISLNDVWNNKANYSGLDNQTGKNGNISADPLFGDGYCLKQGSPAIYGDVSKYEYMGHRGLCGAPTPTPVVTGVIVTTTTTPYPTVECKTGVSTFAVDQPCSINETTSGFRYAYYICYDGYAGILGEDTSCKSNNTWFKYAEKECKGRSSCNPLPSTSPPSPPPEGPITISLKLKFQGIMKRPPNQFNNLVVKITVFGGPIIVADESETTKNPNIFSQQVNFVADDSGVWTGTVSFPYLLPGSDHRILIKGPKHIQKKICDQIPTETYPGSYHCGQGKITLNAGVNNLDFSGIYQLVGDLPDQDGIVNSYDVSLVRNSLNKGDTDSLRLADLNLDGVVNAQDYSLVIAALSIRSDEE